METLHLSPEILVQGQGVAWPGGGTGSSVCGRCRASVPNKGPDASGSEGCPAHTCRATASIRVRTVCPAPPTPNLSVAPCSPRPPPWLLLCFLLLVVLLFTCALGSDRPSRLSSDITSSSSLRPWSVACQASLSLGFPRQEYWSGVPFPHPGNLPHPGIEPASRVLLHCRQVLYH